ncbi:MAG TPA: hypothetical protein VGF55_22100 [Gemmataceae bacterium]|jgi:hypothetical protein
MPSAISSIVQGLKSYAKIVKFQTSHNTVAMAYDGAKFNHTNRAKAVGRAVGGGMATFLAPPVVIGTQAVKDYREKRLAEERECRLGQLAKGLQSHGISPEGASLMAELVVKGTHPDGGWISQADYKMWMVVASTLEPDLAPFTSRIVDRLESEKPQASLS